MLSADIKSLKRAKNKTLLDLMEMAIDLGYFGEYAGYTKKIYMAALDELRERLKDGQDELRKKTMRGKNVCKH